MRGQNPLRIEYLKIINKIDDFNQEIQEFAASSFNLTKKDLMYVISDMEILLDELKDLYEEN